MFSVQVDHRMQRTIIPEVFNSLKLVSNRSILNDGNMWGGAESD